jgi:hypothetical protein
MYGGWILRLAIYYFFITNVLVNGAILFEMAYTPENRNLVVSIFTIAMFILVLLPTYQIGKTGWLKK